MQARGLIPIHPEVNPRTGWTLPLPPAGFGGKGIRTPDFQLAKLALYQLSYAPDLLYKYLFDSYLTFQLLVPNTGIVTAV